MKIVELTIDEFDEESGVEFLSLVKNPATHQEWMVFEDEKDCNGSCQISKHLNETGEELQYLLDNSIGFSMEDLTEKDMTLNKEGFYTINSKPNTVEAGDGNNNQVVRYYYAVDTGLGPTLKQSSRKLCRQLVRADLVYGTQDLSQLSGELTGDGDSFKLVPRTRGTSVDLKIYKAGKFCRHLFKKIVFTIPPDTGVQEFVSKIPKRSRTAINSRISGDGKKPTVEKQMGRGGISEYKIYMSDDYEGPISLIEGLVVYNTIDALFKGEPECMAISEIEFDGIKGFIGVVPDEKYFGEDVKVLNNVIRESFDSYTDYPEYTTENAKRGIRLNEEIGNKCATQTGKIRAQQLANREPISEETIARMYSYLSRAEEYYDPSDDEACGTISVLLWGGLETKDWAERKLKEIREEMKEEFGCIQTLINEGYGEDEARNKCYVRKYPDTSNYPDNVLPLSEDFLYENPCQEGYIAYGTKIKNGRVVPNCVELSVSKEFDRLYDTKEEAEQNAERLGCTGAHSMGDKWMPCSSHNNNYNHYEEDNDKEMIEGVINLINQVDNIEDKKKIAEEAIRNFTEEGVSFDINDFLMRLGLLGQMSFADELKYEITSVVMEPNKYIARRDDMGELYYCYFSEETIKMMSQKFFKQDRHKSFNYEHSGLKLNGGYVVESWIATDPENDKSKGMGFSVNPGTWMVTLKWDDKKQFEDYILNGKTTGISLEGNFLSQPVKMSLQSPEDIKKIGEEQAKFFVDEIIDILKNF